MGSGMPISPSTAAVGDALFRCDGKLILRSTPKPIEHPAIALRWFACTQQFEAWHRLPFFRQLLAHSAAGLSFPVQRLRHRRRAPYVAQKQHLHLKVAALVLHL